MKVRCLLLSVTHVSRQWKNERFLFLAGPLNCPIVPNVDYVHSGNVNDGLNEKMTSAVACRSHCSSIAGAKYFSWNSQLHELGAFRETCWCKMGYSDPINKNGAFSGEVCDDFLDHGEIHRRQPN